MTWLEQILEREGFLISRSSGFGDRLGLGRRGGSLRFIALGDSTKGYKIWFFVVLQGSPPASLSTMNPNALNALTSLGQMHLLFVEEKDTFYFQGEHLSGKELAQKLSQLEPMLTQRPGVRKPLNAGPAPDPFMVFTRNYIAGDATCNDIDAIAPKAGIVLELKKPRSELAQWYPWREDCANYNVIAWIGQQLGWRAITIAYNEDIPHNASLFKEVRCTSPSKRLTFHERRDLFLNDDSSFVRSLRNAFAQL